MGQRVRKTLIKGALEDTTEQVYTDPCCDDSDPQNNDSASITFENTYYARGANGKVKAVYNLAYKVTSPDYLSYIKPDYFLDNPNDGLFSPDGGSGDLDFWYPDTGSTRPVWTYPNGDTLTFDEFKLKSNELEVYIPKISEWYIYGSGAQGRFGSRKPDYAHIFYQGPPDPCYSDYETRILGLKSYEITDHLGNPRVIFSDVREEEYELTYLGGTSYVVSYIGSRPEIVPLEMNNYFPFGMVKEGMFANSGEGYSYGFNGMERDNETKGFGNDLSTFFRGYDPRLARWKSVDPVVHHWESQYVGFANNPVLFVDPRGDDFYKNERTKRLGYVEGISYDDFKDVNGDVWNRFQADVVSTRIRSFWEGVSDGSRQWASDASNYIVDRYNNPGHFFNEDIPNTATGLVEGAKFVGELAIGDTEAEARLYKTIAQTYSDFKKKDVYEWGVSVGYALPEVAIAAASAGISAEVNGLKGLSWIGRGGLSKAAGSGSNQVSLFRAVSKAELDDIAKAGVLRQGAHSYGTGKLFATNPQDAANYGKLMWRPAGSNSLFSSEPFYVIETSISNKYKPFLDVRTMDAMNAVMVPNEYLKYLNQPALHNNILLPKHNWIRK